MATTTAAIAVIGQVALQVLKLCNKCCKEKDDDDKNKGNKQKEKEDDEQEDDDEVSDNNKDEKVSESESESEPEEKKESAPMKKKKRRSYDQQEDDKEVSDNNKDEKVSESESESEPEKKKESAPMKKKKGRAKKKRSNARSVPDVKPVTTQPVTIQATISPVIYNNFQPHPSAIPPSIPPWVLPNGTDSAAADQSVVKWENTSIDDAVEFMDTAIVGGYDIDESDLWIIRARFRCEVIPGKLNQFHKLAFIAYKTEKGYFEKNIDYFEVLCIAPESRNRIRWTACSNGVVPKNAVEAGRKAKGEKLYIGRAIQEDEKYPGRRSLCPGMVQPSHGVLYVTYGFKVYAHKHYEVLCIDD